MTSSPPEQGQAAMRQAERRGSRTADGTIETTARSDTAITCRGLVRIYAAKGIEVQALQGLDLDIGGGELVAIVGASGSGKSTLLGILSAHDRPTAGAAVVAGMPVQALTRAQRLHYRRRVVGFVWQHTERNLVPYLSIEDNLRLARSLGSGRSDRGDGGAGGGRGAELVELMGIGDVLGRRPGEISGGQRQRAAIAVGLVNEPAVLLADEPTGELDDATSADVLEMMRRVNRELGTTTLIVTHDATVSEHVGRTIQIRDGRISSEVFREDHDIRAGTGVHREFTVVDSVGRMQLPAQYMAALDIHDRARLELLDDHVGVYPETPRGAPETPPAGEAAATGAHGARGRHSASGGDSVPGDPAAGDPTVGDPASGGPASGGHGAPGGERVSGGEPGEEREDA